MKLNYEYEDCWVIPWCFIPVHPTAVMFSTSLAKRWIPYMSPQRLE